MKERRNDPALLVVPKNKNQNSEETRRIIKEKVDPVKNPVNLVRKIMNGGIALECTNFEDKDGLKRSVSEQMGADYEVRLTELKKPKIKIIGMYDEWDDETLIKKLKEQNDFMANSDLKVVYKFKGLRGSHNIVLEVSDNSFIKILEAGKVKIHFENCRFWKMLIYIDAINAVGIIIKQKTARAYLYANTALRITTQERVIVNILFA